MNLVTLENDRIRVQIATDVGGRIVSFVNRRHDYEYLWRNPNVPLRKEEPGAPYDPNFFGGIDELLPNDIPETIDGVDCPDHGELWTTALAVTGHTLDQLDLVGELQNFGLRLERTISLAESGGCMVKSRLTNVSGSPRHFMWKLHVAVNIAPGDRIQLQAERYTAADPKWSRRCGGGEWYGETIPEFDGSTEFLYLHPLRGGIMSWLRAMKGFAVVFMPQEFPYAWYFASYGGFDGHHFAVLEPCTSMPISVNEAASLGQCSYLAPGDSMTKAYGYLGFDEDRTR